MLPFYSCEKAHGIAQCHQPRTLQLAVGYHDLLVALRLLFDCLSHCRLRQPLLPAEDAAADRERTALTSFTLHFLIFFLFESCAF